MKSVTPVHTPNYMVEKQVVGIRVSSVGRERLIRGIASYECDPEMGPILRVCIARHSPLESASPGHEWKGKIVAGRDRDCDFTISIS